MTFLYRLSLFTYHIALHIAALFLPKAQKWVTGRQNIFHELASKLTDSQDIIWMHCASLGEFEQGRPLLEAIKKQTPQQLILLTFFSPSGYEIRNNYPLADWVFYLPLDSPKNAARFLDIVQPRQAIFVKYEFWYFYLKTLKQRNIPTYLISAVFRSTQPFFRWYGRLHREMLSCFTQLFVQNASSKKLLQGIDIQNVIIAGDTRVDRVMAIAKNVKKIPKVSEFVGQHSILVAGSTWQPDEAILTNFINKNSYPNWKFIIAPHEIKEENIKRLQKQLTVKTICYSKLKTDQANHFKVLIIDNIGMLSALYQYGKIAYIGGGFGRNIHNTLEPIAFGIPVVFGPKYQSFMEAVTLVETGGGLTFKSAEVFAQHFLTLQESTPYQQAAEQARQYIITQQGATALILKIMNQIPKS